MEKDEATVIGRPAGAMRRHEAAEQQSATSEAFAAPGEHEPAPRGIVVRGSRTAWTARKSEREEKTWRTRYEREKECKSTHERERDAS